MTTTIRTHANGFGNWTAVITSDDSLTPKGAKAMAKVAIECELTARMHDGPLTTRVKLVSESEPQQDSRFATTTVWEFTEG